MNETNKEILESWINKVEQLGLCVKWGYYDNDGFVDFETIWDIDWITPTEILQVTLNEFRYIDKSKEYRLYSDSFPEDDFGQIATFRNAPICCWYYLDNICTDGINIPDEIFDSYNDKLNDNIYCDPYGFMDWANEMYPDSFSVVYEIPDQEKTHLLWEAYTYNPKLSEKEVIRIMVEYLEEILD